jgi:CheY-like chemotaxis protein
MPDAKAESGKRKADDDRAAVAVAEHARYRPTTMGLYEKPKTRMPALREAIEDISCRRPRRSEEASLAAVGGGEVAAFTPTPLSAFLARREGSATRGRGDAGTRRRGKSSMSATATNHVLLIDDDRDVLHGACLRLGAAGYEPTTAVDGRKGIDRAIHDHPDAIVLDVRMPEMDGLEVLSALQQRADTRAIPVIMLSASLVDQDAALEAGARFFLTKPYQSKALLAALSAALREAGGGNASGSCDVVAGGAHPTPAGMHKARLAR